MNTASVTIGLDQVRQKRAGDNAAVPFNRHNFVVQVVIAKIQRDVSRLSGCFRYFAEVL
jgi:hypothetical protein